MKRTICTLAGLMLTLSIAQQSNAQTSIELNGSDTLFNMTSYLLETYPQQCGGDDPNDSSDDYIVYAGGGSTTGEDAMLAGTQQVAPMSRAIKTSKCAGYEDTAEGYAHSLDALSLYRSANMLAENETHGGQCEPSLSCESTTVHDMTVTTNTVGVMEVKDLNGTPGLDCPGCVDYDGDGLTDEYVFETWKDVLSVAYGGKNHNHGSAEQDCASDVRFSLAGLPSMPATGGFEPLPLDCERDCWEDFFMKDLNVDCTDERCNLNWHIWRRGDLSGTTDTFRSLVGISKVPFCNGNEGEDNDPIRRPVHPREDIPGRLDMPMQISATADECAPDGQAQTVTDFPTLGWLLPIVVPPAPNYVTYDDVTGVQDGQKNEKPCAKGKFSWYEVPLRIRPTCVDGVSSVFAQCLLPISDDTCADADCGKPGCQGNPTDNYHIFSALTEDNRSLNMVQINTAGKVVLDETGSEMWSAYYNIHARSTISEYVSPCNEDNSTDQIACLAVASPCSIGYAGMGGGASTDGEYVMEVADVEPTVPNVRTFDYPLTRYLWLNSFVGFSAVTDVDQSQLAACYEDRAMADEAAEEAGFIPLTDNPAAGEKVVASDACP